MKANYTYNVSIGDFFNESISLPISTLHNIPTKNSVFVLYSITAAIQAGALDSSYEIDISDPNNGVLVKLAKTILAGEYDTIHATWPGGLPIFLTTDLASSSGFRSTGLEPGGAAPATLSGTASSAPAGGSLIMSYSYEPVSGRR